MTACWKLLRAVERWENSRRKSHEEVEKKAGETDDEDILYERGFNGQN